MEHAQGAGIRRKRSRTKRRNTVTREERCLQTTETDEEEPISPFSLHGPGERDNKTDERAGLGRIKGHRKTPGIPSPPSTASIQEGGGGGVSSAAHSHAIVIVVSVLPCPPMTKLPEETGALELLL